MGVEVGLDERGALEDRGCLEGDHVLLWDMWTSR